MDREDIVAQSESRGGKIIVPFRGRIIGRAVVGPSDIRICGRGDTPDGILADVRIVGKICVDVAIIRLWLVANCPRQAAPCAVRSGIVRGANCPGAVRWYGTRDCGCSN